MKIWVHIFGGPAHSKFVGAQVGANKLRITYQCSILRFCFRYFLLNSHVAQSAKYQTDFWNIRKK